MSALHHLVVTQVEHAARNRTGAWWKYTTPVEHCSCQNAALYELYGDMCQMLKAGL